MTTAVDAAGSPARGPAPSVQRGEGGGSRRGPAQHDAAYPHPYARRRRRRSTRRAAQHEDQRHRCSGARAGKVGGARPRVTRRAHNRERGEGDSSRREQPSMRTRAFDAARRSREQSTELGPAWRGAQKPRIVWTRFSDRKLVGETLQRAKDQNILGKNLL